MGQKAEYWDRLLDFLNDWASAEEVGLGLIRVDFEGADGVSKSVLIEMTRSEWLDIVFTPWGYFEPAAEEVRKALLAVGDGDRLVVGQYELIAPND